jgi:hypothetical protein
MKQSRKNNRKPKFERTSIVSRIPSKSAMEQIISLNPVFPARSRLLRLPYWTGVTLSSTATLASTYVFSANGAYDPDITSTGHQPMGFDQMMLWYEHYTVMKSKITVNFTNQSSSVGVNVVIAVRPSTTATTDPTTVMENGALVNEKLAMSPQINSIKQLVMATNPGKATGVDDVLDNENLRGDLSNNPTEQTHYHLQSWNVETSATVTVWCEVYIEYWIVFTEPRILSSSLREGLSKLIK